MKAFQDCLCVVFIAGEKETRSVPRNGRGSMPTEPKKFGMICGEPNNALGLMPRLFRHPSSPFLENVLRKISNLPFSLTTTFPLHSFFTTPL